MQEIALDDPSRVIYDPYIWVTLWSAMFFHRTKTGQKINFFVAPDNPFYAVNTFLWATFQIICFS